MKMKMKTLKQILTEGSVTLPANTRSKVNRTLIKAGLDGNGRFESIGSLLGIISGCLELHGIQVSDVFSADRFRETSKHQTFHLEFSNPQDPFSPIPINNSLLSLSYNIDKNAYRGGKTVDAVAYLS